VLHLGPEALERALWNPLATETLTALRDDFAKFNHSPSPAQWEALADLAKALEAMACQRRGNSDPPLAVVAEVKLTHPGA
jgi:hypothetical protein